MRLKHEQEFSMLLMCTPSAVTKQMFWQTTSRVCRLEPKHHRHHRCAREPEMDCIPPRRPWRCLSRGENADNQTRVHCYRTAVWNEVRGVHLGWYTPKLKVLLACFHRTRFEVTNTKFVCAATPPCRDLPVSTFPWFPACDSTLYRNKGDLALGDAATFST
jgi:hypothetical protein